MAAQTSDLSVNPSDETIRFGPLAVRFLLTGDDSTGSIAAFEPRSAPHTACPRRPTATTITRRRSTASTAC